MGLSLNALWLIAFLLAFARAVAWLSVAPPFSDQQVIPRTATACVAAGLAILVAPELATSSLPSTAPAFIADIVFQVVTGAAMGQVLNMLLSAFSSAGGLIDLTGGLNLPAPVDPLSLDQMPMIAQFYQQVALLLLFVSGGYVLVVAGFLDSFRLRGLTLSSTSQIAGVLAGDLSTLFVSALEMAGPILAVLFGTQIVLALLSKAAPQVNVWLLGMPLQIFLALSLVALAVSALPAYTTGLATHAVADMSALFGGR